jgi:hypothetical protein
MRNSFCTLGRPEVIEKTTDFSFNLKIIFRVSCVINEIDFPLFVYL